MREVVLIRLFSIVDTKQILTPFFVFVFCQTLFYSDTKPKVGPNFLCFGILKHKKGSKFVSEERRHTKHKSVVGEWGGRIARSSGRVEWESDRFQ